MSSAVFRDIVHASLQSDLNSYSGFALPILTEQGLMSVTWGAGVNRNGIRALTEIAIILS